MIEYIVTVRALSASCAKTAVKLAKISPVAPKTAPYNKPLSISILSIPKRAIPNPMERASNTFVATLTRSEEHTSELQSRFDLVCRLLLEKKKYNYNNG